MATYFSSSFVSRKRGKRLVGFMMPKTCQLDQRTTKGDFVLASTSNVTRIIITLKIFDRFKIILFVTMEGFFPTNGETELHRNGIGSIFFLFFEIKTIIVY